MTLIEIPKRLIGLTRWAAAAWRPVGVETSEVERLQFSHCQSWVSDDHDLPGVSGYSLWTAPTCDEPDAYLVWQWAEVLPGVIALADPTNVQSNLHVVDRNGRGVPPMVSIAHLNRLVHQLKWQSAVRGVRDH